MDSWTSASKGSRAAEFRAEFLYDSGNSNTIHMVTITQMQQVIDGSSSLGMVALSGTVYFDLLVWGDNVVSDSDVICTDELLNELRADMLTTAFISPCHSVSLFY